MKIDKNIIKELSECLEEFNLTELSYSDGKTEVKVSKNNKQISSNIAALSNTKMEVETNDDPSVQIIKSPMVGTAYLSPEPGAKPFATVGSKIKKGSKIIFKENHKGNIDTLRPGNGLDIKHLDYVRNSKASNDLIAGTPLRYDDIIKI